MNKKNNLLISEIFSKIGTSDSQTKNLQNSKGSDSNNKPIICLIRRARDFLNDEKLGLPRKIRKQAPPNY